MIEYHHKFNELESSALACGVIGSCLFVFSIFTKWYEINIIVGMLFLYMLIAYIYKYGVILKIYVEGDFINVKSNRKYTSFKNKKVKTREFNKASIKVGALSSHGKEYFHYDLILHGNLNTITLLRVNNENDAVAIRNYLNEVLANP